MALPTWPATVPSAVQRGYYRVSKPFNEPDTTEFEAGNTRDRARGSVQYRKIEYGIRMTATELAAFESFVETDLVTGTLRFTMPVWMGQAAVTKTVKLSGSDKYTAAPKGRNYIVTFSLEVEL